MPFFESDIWDSRLEQQIDEDLDNAQTDIDTTYQQLKDSIPIGSVLPFAGETVPTNFLVCDGSELNRNTFDELFAIVGERFGGGDGLNTFNVPNLQNRYIRGREDGTGGPEHCVGGIVGQNSRTHGHMMADHSHVVDDHHHIMCDHGHSILDHQHTTCTHQHTMCTHCHTTCSHSHAVGSHRHTVCSHTHAVGGCKLANDAMPSHAHPSGDTYTYGLYDNHRHSWRYLAHNMCWAYDAYTYLNGGNYYYCSLTMQVGNNHTHHIGATFGSCGNGCSHGHGRSSCAPTTAACAPGSTSCSPIARGGNSSLCSYGGADITSLTAVSTCTDISGATTLLSGTTPTDNSTSVVGNSTTDNRPVSLVVNYIIRVQ